MQLSEDVNRFGKACEHMLASIAMHRPLTEDEKSFIEYYCNEVLNKVKGNPPK